MKQWVVKMIKKMELNKAKGQSTSNWVLDCCGHYDWHTAAFKNPSRDYLRFAQHAYVEVTLMDKYRKKLLTKSRIAAFIRHALHTLLSSHCKPRTIVSKESSKATKIVRQYTFLDGLTTAETNKPTINANNLVVAQDSKKKINRNRQALMILSKHIENAPFTVACPDTNLLNQEIAEKIDDLKNVSPHIPNLSNLTILLPYNRPSFIIFTFSVRWKKKTMSPMSILSQRYGKILKSRT